MSNNIIFRADSSNKIATGHIMRCLTIAKRLRKEKAKIKFICRNLKGNIISRIIENNFEVEILPKPEKKLPPSITNQYLQWLEVDLIEDAKQTIEILEKIEKNITLIIDHYAIYQNWQNKIRNFVKKIVVIDDLANRKHNCDILIDQNLCHNYQSRYDNLTPNHCQKLLGPHYRILQEQFFRTKPRKRTKIKNIIIFFGGIDPNNISLKAVKAVIKTQEKLQIKFNVTIIGSNNNYQTQIKKICQKNNFQYISYTKEMTKIMDWADLSIGAGGSATWERCHLFLPSIVISIAQNQVEICQNLHNKGIINYLGNSDNVSEQNIVSCLSKLHNEFNFKILDFPSKFDKLIKIIYEN